MDVYVRSRTSLLQKRRAEKWITGLSPFIGFHHSFRRNGLAARSSQSFTQRPLSPTVVHCILLILTVAFRNIQKFHGQNSLTVLTPSTQVSHPPIYGLRAGVRRPRAVAPRSTLQISTRGTGVACRAHSRPLSCGRCRLNITAIWFRGHNVGTRGPLYRCIDERLWPNPETGRASRWAYRVPKGHTILCGRQCAPIRWTRSSCCRRQAGLAAANRCWFSWGHETSG